MLTRAVRSSLFLARLPPFSTGHLLHEIDFLLLAQPRSLLTKHRVAAYEAERSKYTLKGRTVCMCVVRVYLLLLRLRRLTQNANPESSSPVVPGLDG